MITATVCRNPCTDTDESTLTSFSIAESEKNAMTF